MNTVHYVDDVTQRVNSLVDWDLAVVQFEPLLWEAVREGYKTQRSNDVRELLRRIWFEEDRVEQRRSVR